MISPGRRSFPTTESDSLVDWAMWYSASEVDDDPWEPSNGASFDVVVGDVGAGGHLGVASSASSPNAHHEEQSSQSLDIRSLGYHRKDFGCMD